ncbi:hypothetical protein HYFRA_00002383 [Hymenoscyphus fraxineus]|uniref:Uncharacterized protein n=1 Tax=Hymenoscyphus fraxineus TaxID=746836 RepID=A0A9N9PV15_9HELO|nr:hypothetical protein HYFRA_00002383 [Hymenoscyphus fraxineus]
MTSTDPAKSVTLYSLPSEVRQQIFAECLDTNLATQDYHENKQRKSPRLLVALRADRTRILYDDALYVFYQRNRVYITLSSSTVSKSHVGYKPTDTAASYVRHLGIEFSRDLVKSNDRDLKDFSQFPQPLFNHLTNLETLQFSVGRQSIYAQRNKHFLQQPFLCYILQKFLEAGCKKLRRVNVEYKKYQQELVTSMFPRRTSQISGKEIENTDSFEFMKAALHMEGEQCWISEERLKSMTWEQLVYHWDAGVGEVLEFDAEAMVNAFASLEEKMLWMRIS